MTARRPPTRRRAAGPLGVRPRRPLRLEGLEDRLAPATFNVATTADLFAAVTKAAKNADPSNTILVAPGTYEVVDKTINTQTSGEKQFKALTVHGAGPGATVFTAHQQGRVLSLYGQVTLEGLTITGGRVAPGPSDNRAAVAGGLSVQMGRHTLRNVVVEGNTVIGADARATPELNAPDGDTGRGATGGGIYLGAGTLDMFNCTVRDNSVVSGNGGNGLDGAEPGYGGGGGNATGGGIYQFAGTLTLVGCTISDNTVMAGDGGNGGKYEGLPANLVPHDAYRSSAAGGWALGGGLAVENSGRVVGVGTTISDNTVQGGRSGLAFLGGAGQGGGFYLDRDCTADFFDLTVTGNTATGGDGRGSRGAPLYQGDQLVGEYFYTNEAGPGQGGGGYVGEGANLSVGRGTFTNDTATGGAGGNAAGQYVNISHTETAPWGHDGGIGGDGAGGALYQAGGTVRLYDGTYSDSAARGGPGGDGAAGGPGARGGFGGAAGPAAGAAGGGLFVGGGALTAFRLTISNDSATGGAAGAAGAGGASDAAGGNGGGGAGGGLAEGGGVHVGHGGSVTLVDSTLASDVATGGPGGRGGDAGGPWDHNPVEHSGESGPGGPGGPALGGGLYGFGKVYLYHDSISGTATGGAGGDAGTPGAGARGGSGFSRGGDGGNAKGAGVYLAGPDPFTGGGLVDAIVRGLTAGGSATAGAAGGGGLGGGSAGQAGTEYDNDSSFIPGTAAPAATRFATSPAPPGLLAGQPFPFPLYAVATDDAGNVAADYNGLDPGGVAGRLAVALQDNPAGATLTGTLKAQAVNGVAVFDDLSLDKPGTGYTLAATGANDLAAGVTDKFNVAGLNATVKGVVFADVNANGAWNKPAEAPLAGAAVELVLPDGSTRRTTTDPAGKYAFTGLPKGDVRVRLVPADDQVQTAPADPHGFTRTLSQPNQVVTLPDFGRADGVETRVAVQSVTSTLPGVSVPGEECKVTVTVRNDGVARANAGGGDVLVTVYALAGGQRYRIGTQAVAAGKVFGLAPKQVLPIQVACKFPALGDPAAVPEGTFRYEAVLGPAWKNATGTAAADSQHLYQFGTVGAGALARKDVRITVRQDAPAFVEAKYALAGPGTGFVADAAGVVDLTFQGTTAASQASAVRTAGAGTPSVRDLTAGDLGGLTMPDVDVTGQVSFASLDTLNVRELGGDPDGELTIGGGSSGRAAVAGRAAAIPKEARDIRAAVIKGDIIAPFGVARIVAGKWLDDDDRMDLVTPFLRFLTIGGEMQADLDVTGPPARGQALVQATVGGAVKDSVWRLRDPGGAGRIQVGSADEWQLLSDGPVTLLQVRGDYKQRRNNPSMRATAFGGLELLGYTDARGIEVTGQADQAAIGRLKVGVVVNLFTLTAPAGGIRSVEAQGWVADTAIVTPWVGTLTVKGVPKVALSGNFKANLRLTGTGPDGKTSLGRATVDKDVTGAWQAFGDVGPVTAGGDIIWGFAGGVGDGSPGTDLAGLTAVILGGATEARAIGPVKVSFVSQATLHLTGAWSQTSPVASLVASRGIEKLTVVVDHADSGFSAISAPSWKGGSVTGGYVGQLKITKPGAALGKLENVTFNLPGQAPGGLSRGKSLGAMSADEVTDCVFTFGGDVGTVAAYVFTGSTFKTPRDINRFLVIGKVAEVLWGFSATTVEARSIGTVVLYDVDTGSHLSPFRIKADFVGKYTRYAAGRIALPDGRPLTEVGEPKLDGTPYDSVGNYTLVIT